MPLLVTHSPWVYWAIAVFGFVVLYAFSYRIVNRVFYQQWVRHTNSYKAQGYFHGPLVDSVPAMVFLVLSLLVYAVATYLGQYGYAFAWYAILVAIDVFASPLNLVVINRTGGQNSPPPAVQTELLYIDLVMDALIAASAVGATFLFLNAVVLA